MLHRDEYEGRGYPNGAEQVPTDAQFKRGLLFILLLIVGIIAGVAQSWVVAVIGSISALALFAILLLFSGTGEDE